MNLVTQKAIDFLVASDDDEWDLDNLHVSVKDYLHDQTDTETTEGDEFLNSLIDRSLHEVNWREAIEAVEKVRKERQTADS